MTIGPIESSQQPGRGYGTPYTEALLDELVRMGVTWVSITPFGRIWSLESTDITMDFEAPYEDNRAAIARFVEQAHARFVDPASAAARAEQRSRHAGQKERSAPHTVVLRRHATTCTPFQNAMRPLICAAVSLGSG